MNPTTKWLIPAAAVVALVGLLLWKVQQAPAPATVRTPAAKPAKPAPQALHRAPIRRAPAKSAPAAEVPSTTDDAVEVLAPTSEKFNDRIDVGFANVLRAKAMHCYRKDVRPNAEMNLTYQLTIANGKAKATNVRVVDSEMGTFNDNCFVNAMQNYAWDTPDMPDFVEEQELFIRMRSMKKYASRAEMFDEWGLE